jgi:cell division protein FtsB
MEQQKQGIPIDPNALLQVYKREFARVQDENMMLHAYIKQLEDQQKEVREATSEETPKE